jgi:hypothetical protein
MITPLQTVNRLLWGPGLGLGFGLMLVLFFYPAFGLHAATVVGVCVGFSLFAGLGYTAWRSVYGSSQGIVSSVCLALLVGALGAGAGSAAAAGTGSTHGGLVMAVGSGALTVIALLVSAIRHWQQLWSAAHSGTWFREAVDVSRAWVHEVAPASSSTWGGFWSSPWMIGALSVNAFALLRAVGWTDFHVLLVGALVMNAMSAWIGWAVSGPMLARALYIRDLERQLGITFVHPQLDEIQALRSRWFFTRWLMPKRPS